MNQMEWNWREYFDRKTLEDGIRDEKNGLVTDYKEDPKRGTVSATVRGAHYVVIQPPVSFQDLQRMRPWRRRQEDYGSSAYLWGMSQEQRAAKNMENYRYSCSCSQGDKHYLCRHVAAVLAHYEKLHGKIVFRKSAEDIRREEEQRRQRELEKKREEEQKKLDSDYIPVDHFLKKGMDPENGYFHPDGCTANYVISRFEALKVKAMLDGKSGFRSNGVEFALSPGEAETAKAAASADGAKIVTWEQFETAPSDDGQLLHASLMVGMRRVKFIVSDQRIEDCSCTCGKTRSRHPYYSYGQDPEPEKVFCAHALIAWRAVENRIGRENPGDATDERGDAFLRLLTGDLAAPAERPADTVGKTRKKDIILKPRIVREMAGSRAKLGFLVGRAGERMYIVRDMGQLADAIEGKTSYEVSKKTSFDFSEEDITDDSTVWIPEMKRHAASNTIIRRMASRYTYASVTGLSASTIDLEGSLLDKVYRSLEGGKVLYVLEKNEHIIPVLRAEAKVNLRLTPEKKGDDVIAVKAHGYLPKIEKGAEGSYILDQDRFWLLSDQAVSELMPLQNLADRDGSIDFRIGKKHLAEFYYRVLPRLQESGVIRVKDQAKGEVADLMPEEPAFTFYLDLSEKQVLCRATVQYGEEKPFSLLRRGEAQMPARTGAACDSASAAGTPDTAAAGIAPGAGAPDTAAAGIAPGAGAPDAAVGFAPGAGAPDTAAAGIAPGAGAPDAAVGFVPGAYARDFLQEKRVEDLLLSYFPRRDPKQDRYLAKADDTTLPWILLSGVDALSRFGEVKGTEAFRKVEVRPVPVPKVSVSLESNLLDLSVASTDMAPGELLALLDSYHQRKKWHRLKSGNFISLENGTEALDELTELTDSLGISLEDAVKGGAEVPKYQAVYVDRMLEEHDKVASSRNRPFRSLIRSFRTISDSDYEVPTDVAEKLRSYQKYGYQWLRTLAATGFGGILADEMGLGKTLQMLSCIEGMKNDGEAKPFLVVCPASLVYNWKEEAAKFTPSLGTAVLAGTKAERREALAGLKKGSGDGQTIAADSSPADLYITSYDTCKRDIEMYEGIHFAGVILDEAQFAKNQNTAAAKALKTLKADTRFALTGTPIENRLSELWNIFDFLMPGFLYSAQEFRQKFELPVMKEKDGAAAERLSQMTRPFILRRRKEDVLKDLPEKLEETQMAQMGSEQRHLYDAQVVSIRKMLDEGSMKEDRFKVLAGITRLRQICCDPSLLFEDYHGESAKRKACIDLIERSIDAGHRILLFSQFTAMLDLLKKDLQEKNITYYEITGATPKKERIELVDAFNEGSVPLFLISLRAGGTGLNLTGADVVIHYDPWWNLAVMNQATDRAHRIGQTKKVTVVKLVMADTIEEKIISLQQSKQDLADQILAGKSDSLAAFTDEEVLQLLE